MGPRSLKNCTNLLILCFMTLLCACSATATSNAGKTATATPPTTISDKLDVNQSWAIRMAESEMVRFPEAWMIDWRDDGGRWDYVHGLNLLAFSKLYEETGEQRYFDYIKGYYDRFIDDEGNISTYDIESYNIDMINAGKVLFFLYDNTGDKRYLKAADLLRSQLTDHPRTEQGGFWHKKRYPHQMWLDGLYMGAPFYTQYIMRYEDPAQLDDVIKQFKLIEQNLYVDDTGLPRHGWDASGEQRWADNNTGLSPHHWGRAIGWYSMAIVDVLAELPTQHPQRDWLIERFRNLVDQMAKYQHSSGAWYQLVDLGQREGNYLEGSVTSMMAYSIAKAVNIHALPDSYMEMAETAFQGLIDQMISVDPQNNVVSLNQVCAVAGLGGNPYRDGSFDYYISEPIRANDAKGVGPFILAAIELGR